MVDEKEGHYEAQEEEEYHFSDDQANYEMEADAPKIVEPEKVKVPVMQQISQRRNIIIGAVVFAVLLGIIYKMIVPASESPSTDFSQATAASHPAVTVTPQSPASASLNAQMAAMQQQAQKMPADTTTMPQQSQQPQHPPLTTLPQQTAAQPTPPDIISTGSPVPSIATAPASDVGQSKAIMDRLATLEQQNAALMNLLQTEYAQKLSDAETQSTMMRGKLTEVTKRVNRMEASLAQITRMLQNGGNRSMDSLAPAAPEGVFAEAPPAAKMSEPKMTYTVQAIIPGRAWLKSESGDTVTVAEGDVLKGYGRVVKIDPYDGVVNIDTGNKVMTLSYGVGGG